MPPLTLPELERLHALYADGVFRFFCMNTGSRHEGEDLVQEFQKVSLQTVASRLRYATARLRERLQPLYAEIK